MHVLRRASMFASAALFLFASDPVRADPSAALPAGEFEAAPVAEACPDDPAAPPEAAPAAAGSTSNVDMLKGLPKVALQDAEYVLGSPVRWTAKDWAIAGGAAAGLVAVAAFADVAARDQTQRHKSSALDDLTRIVEPFGAEYSWGVLGVYGVVGFLFHDADARDTAIDGILASALASGIVTPSLKRIIGRSRPDQSDDPLTFHAFQSGYTSMPSGHATQAFAVASVISAHSDQLWVSASAYTLAGLVAFARVYHNVHWASDVVAGALIGTAVGRGVVALNRRIRSGEGHVKIVFAPILGESERGAGLTILF